MTNKRDPNESAFFNQRADMNGPSTLRSVEAAAEVTVETELPVGPVYVEPKPLVALSDHKTIEVETVKLADDIDPRKLPTELRLARPPSIIPPDSGWPHMDVGLVSSQPPLPLRRRFRGPLALCALLCALTLLLLARSSAQRARAAADAATPSAPSASQVAAPPSETPSSAVTTTPVPSASTEPSPVEVAPSAPPSTARSELRAEKHAAPGHSALKSNTATAPNASSPTPSVSKPKRAIY